WGDFAISRSGIKARSVENSVSEEDEDVPALGIRLEKL
ncbi:MAG: hypothetical protein ACI9M9_002144, partial [Flavobacteriaceae bacterium]